jgi:hypothetical protein
MEHYRAFPVQNSAGTLIGTISLDEQIVEKLEEAALTGEDMFEIVWAFSNKQNDLGRPTLVYSSLRSPSLGVPVGVITQPVERCPHTLYDDNLILQCRLPIGHGEIFHRSEDGVISWKP